ncbi:hypothetical protein H6F88_09915 [Oculatella sp. FACHB-28]|uniref:hypothetical protein n=1 Tax=Oculatella sp. FACHB-28 TaxID=2692845 RepID=UPI001684F9B1|nr:hypothetical protein [Oculatella sp. FACHB-28]MBD2056331.1 hypothetical protein [Oculatella sp. FACHB-28]
MLSRQGCFYYTSQPTQTQKSSATQGCYSNLEQLTDKLSTAVWRLTVNFTTPLATSTRRVK